MPKELQNKMVNIEVKFRSKLDLFKALNDIQSRIFDGEECGMAEEHQVMYKFEHSFEQFYLNDKRCKSVIIEGIMHTIIPSKMNKK